MERRNFVKNIGAGALLLGMGGFLLLLARKKFLSKIIENISLSFIRMILIAI